VLSYLADACARAGTPDKIARATTSPAILRHVKTGARVNRSANSTTRATVPKVSRFFSTSYHAVKSRSYSSKASERWNFFVSTRTISSRIFRSPFFPRSPSLPSVTWLPPRQGQRKLMNGRNYECVSEIFRIAILWDQLHVIEKCNLTFDHLSFVSCFRSAG